MQVKGAGMSDYSLYTRRTLLRHGGALAAAGFGIARLRAAEPSPLMTVVGNYMAEAGNRALPDAVIEKAKQMILDTFAAMISGSELPPGRFAIGFTRGYG